MLMNYYRRMDRSKIQFDFMVNRTEQGHYDDEIRAMGGKIYPMPAIRPGNYNRYFKALDSFFSQNREYRVVHSHINENSGFVLRAAKRAGIPCRIAHSHLSDLGIDLKLPFRLYARYSMKGHPTHYFACSKKAGQWLFGNKVEEQHGITVLNNAVHVPDFEFNEQVRNEVRDEIGAGGRTVIGHVGRFNKQKNHTFLIDIFQEIHRKNPDTLLLLVGEGRLKAEIEAKVSKLGLSGNVKFLGVRSDITRLLQGIDLFLFPSLFEGLPVVLVEAQAAGLNCIVSDTITTETDVTGRLHFVSLKDSAEQWANVVCGMSHEHADTSELLRSNGYDADSMADWLTSYYFGQMKMNT
ncbi:glycosyltransferase family 1 protein [Paenibacillus harenae]|uniref:glycosyltransferase family 1 protein n=1 Tax=Paenibacillus harenae TaxID=306543 RepID=UPI0027D7F8E6|nr:glycosyltransferase family 1 protein [Paenibacillus harenae]